MFLRMPAGFSMTGIRRRYEWGYRTGAEPGVLDREFPCPRGRVLGGSSSINAMCFVRGHRKDFDDWAAGGLSGWSYEDCLPYFKRMETCSRGGDAFRGDGGPLQITVPTYSNSLNDVFIAAAEQAGYRRVDDTNGAEQEGFGPVDQTIHNGRRVSASSAYLDPVRDRKNLDVRTGAFAERILMDARRATGVCYRRGRTAFSAHARKEVIVCAGAINSPQLLMCSGIGPAEHLNSVGAPVLIDHPSVGDNLQDHVDVSVKFTCKQPVSAMPSTRYPKKPIAGLQWVARKSGPAATNHFESAGYIRTRAELLQPNIQVLFIPLIYNADGSPVPWDHGYLTTVMPLRPKSRGMVRLQSANTHEPPLLQFNYLSHPDDLPELREGVRRARQILRQPAFDAYRGVEVAPGDELETDAEIDAYILENVKPNYHPCGTCRMGRDAKSVVDQDARVRGIDNLRIIDASIMPEITSGNINAPTLMLAEKLSDAVLRAG